MLGVLLMVLISAGFLSNSFAQEVPTPVSAKLVSNVTTVNPGDSFNLGVLMEIDPGWHVYWKNPGDSGLPTKVNFEVPAGFETSTIKWPIPSSFKGPESGVDFGYENSVLLWTNIEVPKEAKLNSIYTIPAEISWISCKEICIPGRASLRYDLKVGEEKVEGNSDLFSKWNNLLPVDAEHRDNPFEIEVSSSKSASNTYAVVLKLNSRSKLDTAEYYPNPGEDFVVQNLNYHVLSDTNAIKISFDVVSNESASSFDTELDGLIVYTDADKNRSGIEVKIDLNDM